MKIYKYGDNVDTDVIIPARHLNDPDPKALASHCMEDIDKDFAKTVEEGDIMVAGANFGCGSIGLPVLECPEAAEGIQPGDRVSVDFATGVITDETRGKTWQAMPLPKFIDGIVQSGGLLKSLKARGVAK